MSRKEPEEFKKQTRKLTGVEKGKEFEMKKLEEELHEMIEETNKDKKRYKKYIDSLIKILKKPINKWFFLALILIFIEWESIFIINKHFLPKGNLPYNDYFKFSKITVWTEVSNKLNLFNKNVVVQNDIIFFDFNITNFEEQKVKIEYKYHFIRPNNTDLVYAGNMILNQNETKTDTVSVLVKDLGANIIEFEFEMFDAKMESFITNSLRLHYFQVISQSDAMELDYRKIYLTFLIIATIPSTVIGIKNLRDLCEDR